MTRQSILSLSLGAVAALATFSTSAEQVKEAFACQQKETGPPDIILMRVDNDASVYTNGQGFLAHYENNARNYAGQEHTRMWRWQKLEKEDGSFRYQYAFTVDEESRTGFFFDFPNEDVKRSLSDKRFRCNRAE